MKKTLGIAAVLFALACSSPESRTESTSDSINKTNENRVTNSPPGFSTDTSGQTPRDTATSDTMKHQ